MAKSYFLSRDESGKRAFLNNFAAKLPVYAPDVAVTPAEVTQTTADDAYFDFVCGAHTQHTNTTREWTAYKNALRSGTAIGALPTTPMLGTPPTAVPAGIFIRVAALAGRIKKHPAYTDAMGQDLGIIGAEQSVDPSAMKPILNLTLQAGHPNVGWAKSGMDSLEIWVDRGTGTFAFLTIDTVPDYLDTAALPAPGVSAAWKYKAIYRLNDEQVGQWSDVATIGVMG